MPYSVSIKRLPLFAVFDLKGDQKALSDCIKTSPLSFPDHPNTYAEKDNRLTCYIGPQHWLVRAGLDQESDLETALNVQTAPPDISIVKVSDTLTFFRITGTDAAEILSVGCPLDVHDSVFAQTGASYTEFFGLKALVLRVKDGFDVAVEQSFANMIDDYLTRANA